MTLVQFPQYRRQQKLLIILIILIFAIILVLYFGFWRRPAKKEIISEVSESINSIPRLELDTNFFEEPNYQNLEFYGQWPIEVKEIGRENPFLP